MKAAAQRGLAYHLWWHPHNFGDFLDENLAMLDHIIATFCKLRDEHGLRSLTMAQAAEQLTA